MIFSLKAGIVLSLLLKIKPSPKTSLNLWSSYRLRVYKNN
nr:MAG TPA: hypothetical protein [Caudoviricetes sp.]